MIGMYAIIGIAMLAGGIAIGIFTMVSIGTRRAERIFRRSGSSASGTSIAGAGPRARHGLSTGITPAPRRWTTGAPTSMTTSGCSPEPARHP